MELVSKTGSNIHFELVGLISDAEPNFAPPLGVPIEIRTVSDPVDLILRIKRLEDCEPITASGRILARKV